jgi:hypothetical protein
MAKTYTLELSVLEKDTDESNDHATNLFISQTKVEVRNTDEAIALAKALSYAATGLQVLSKTRCLEDKLKNL